MSDESYVVQHFGASARTLVNTVYNTCFDYLGDCLDSLKTAVLETLKDEAPADLDQRMDTLFAELSTSLDKDCDRLQLFTERNVMRVPSYVLLPGDEVHRTPPDGDAVPVAVLKAQVATLKKRIAEEKMKQQELKDELAHQDVVRRHLRSTLEQICQVQATLPQAADASSNALPEGSDTMGGGELLPTGGQEEGMHDSISSSDLVGPAVPEKDQALGQE